MHIYAPKYYRDFKCIADKCKNSCCVGWEIDVDEDALSRYEALPEPTRGRILGSIEDYPKGSSCERQTADSGEPQPHFRLRADERCPHLTDGGLCRIISELGEGYLCDICKEHPRFYNTVILRSDERPPIARLEVGLGMSCEAAAELILGSDEYEELLDLTESGIGAPYLEQNCAPEIDIAYHRARLYRMIRDKDSTVFDKLNNIADLYGANPDRLKYTWWREIFSSLEYLSPRSKDIFLSYGERRGAVSIAEDMLERFFAYAVFRHVSPATTREELSVSVGFAVLLTKLYLYCLDMQTIIYKSEAFELARIISIEIEYSEDNTKRLKDIIRLECRI